jgi:serine/threonine protein kinase
MMAREHAADQPGDVRDAYDVATLMARIGPLQPQAAVRIALQSTRALLAAREEGLAHRDLQSSQIVLHRAGDAITVKVTSSENEQSGLDEAWTLGVTLWSMLAGCPPRSFAIGTLVSADRVPWIQDAAPWIEPALADSLHAMLLPDRKTRPSLTAIVASLAPFVGDRESLRPGDLVAMTPEQRAVTAPRGESAAKSVSGASADPMYRPHLGTTTNPPVGVRSYPSESAQQASLIGETLGGRYRLDRLLGHGGMGAVYEAEGPSAARVAVKVVLGDNRKPDALRRFVREARTTTAIDNPHVVRVLDVDGDSSRGVPFIVMELLRGTDLEQTIRLHGALEADVVARIFVQACSGLAAAHEQGVVHRDIKPANIFLHQEADGHLITKICDFGIAKQLQSERDSDAALDSTNLTHTGSMIGSPPYMSPEQARSSKDIDARSDVWSLGAALYEALSGRRVWQGRTSLGELMAAIIREPVPRLEDAAPWIDPALADVVAKALQKDPTQRFATMKEFAEALEPFAAPADKFQVDSVRPISNQRRSAIPRSPSGRRVTGETSASFARSGAPVQTQRRSPIVLPLAIVTGIVAAAVAVLVLTRVLAPEPKPAPVATTTTTPAASTSAPTPSTPPSATIAVTATASVVPNAPATSASLATAPIPSITQKTKPPVVPKATATTKKPDEPPPNIF